MLERGGWADGLVGGEGVDVGEGAGGVIDC